MERFEFVKFTGYEMLIQLAKSEIGWCPPVIPKLFKFCLVATQVLHAFSAKFKKIFQK